MARIIGEVQPRYAFVENSPMLTSRGLGTVLGDLASLGFDAEWGVLSAADVGANHLRERIWILGKNTEQSRFLSHTEHNGYGWWEQQSESVEETNGAMADTDSWLCGGRGAIESGGENKIGRLHFEETKQTEDDLRSEVIGCSFLRTQKEFSNTQYRGLEKSWKHEQSINSKTSKDWKTSFIVDGCSSNKWAIEPKLDRVVDGMANRVDRLKAIGNGQVPFCAATAWKLLNERLDK